MSCRTRILGYVAILILLALLEAFPAHADECSTTAYATFQTSYPYQVTPVEGSLKPVLIGGATESCGKWWFDVSGPKDLSGKETFGNEVDLTAAYDSTASDFHYEALISWWMLPKFGSVRDDLLQMQFEVSRPFALRGMTIEPYVRMTHLQTFGAYANADVAKAGVRIEVPLATRWSLSGDAEVADDFSNGITIRRLNARVAYDMGGGWSANAGVKLADQLKPAYVLGIAKHF